jgi:hypothetical protein
MILALLILLARAPAFDPNDPQGVFETPPTEYRCIKWECPSNGPCKCVAEACPTRKPKGKRSP